ncbi:TIGR01777 family oxidoreductase [Shewanella eurypsychrophilus]|uniref:TIGR01777 family oxidoreductase n=1 Tax=Shewanella eurypsychrophilus TaxID=2593656 RepID=A0ABX6V7E2_9GAMM|nr:MULTISPECIES: TIGR01777 family oxidoreductase [Shewanella]QFU23336.1 TIGR01777 family protein [Shewanella sp. YLB-09]QPG58565.1 TIGR01777 family oxidoreductase [Shewanella eurypsychrophilus]
MKILISGATGFIGHQLVRVLSHENKLTILTRSPANAHKQLGAEHQYLGNLTSLSELNEFDAVINLAGEPIVNKRWSEKQKQLICESRWQLTSRIAELIKASEHPPKIFISSSAIGIYGSLGTQLIDESYELTLLDEMATNSFPLRVCSRWESLALDAQSDKTRVCIVRTGLVLGLSGGALAKMLLPFKFGLGGPIGTGQQGMSWIHQDDQIGLMQFLLNNEKCNGIYNATAPTPVSNYKFSKQLGQALSRPALIPMPAAILKLVLGEMSELLTQGQFIIPTRALKAGYQFKYTELHKALEDLLKSVD